MDTSSPAVHHPAPPTLRHQGPSSSIVDEFKLVAQREFCNQFVIEVLNGKVRPHEYSRIAWNFLAHGGQGSITLEVYCRPSSMLQTALWGNGNLCRVTFLWRGILDKNVIVVVLRAALYRTTR